MDEEYKVVVPVEEYRELCRTAAKMAAVIDYLKEHDYIEERFLKAIIGPEKLKK